MKDERGQVALPAIAAELRLEFCNGVPVVNSRDVAEFFEKEHRNVLRDIDDLRGALNSEQTSWFRLTTYFDVQGKPHRSFDLTRQGFTLLVMGWTGEKAIAFKVRYIEAFDAMERALNENAPITGTDLIKAVREIVAPLAIRFDGQDKAIERIDKRIDTVAEDLASIKARLFDGRRRLTEATKREHVETTKMLGGLCPCCSQASIVTDGVKSPFSQFDHFYQNSQPNAEHTWLICSPCHNKFTTGQVARDQREAEFRAYQNRRRRLPDRQMTLFG